MVLGTKQVRFVRRFWIMPLRMGNVYFKNHLEQLECLSDEFWELGELMCQINNCDSILVPVDDLDRCVPGQAIPFLVSLKNIGFMSRPLFFRSCFCAAAFHRTVSQFHRCDRATSFVLPSSTFRFLPPQGIT